MKFLFYFGHPAQYLFLRETIRRLKGKEQNEVLILIKSKDVLENLLIADGLPYENILVKQRGKGKIAILLSLLNRMVILLPLIRNFKPDLMVSTDASIAQLGFLLRVNRITIIEDDYALVKSLARLTYPFTQVILCPHVCDVGPWQSKKVGYNGYMKLGYLHPTIFEVAEDIIAAYEFTHPYVIIRLAKLTAHHDDGIEGLTYTAVENLIALAKKYERSIYISAEYSLPNQLKPYELKIEPIHMHHVLAQADLLVCDSQSMSVEAAMLGTPSIRYSSFAGRISVLEELELDYGLTFGINPGSEAKLLQKFESLLGNKNLKLEFTNKKDFMLSEKINVTDFVHSFLVNYPNK